ncbi:hypothetical protein CF319_g6985 [Tilletia indica]|nr:hypothetical protein CF319_g6985 [Tilletia indica]
MGFDGAIQGGTAHNGQGLDVIGPLLIEAGKKGTGLWGNCTEGEVEGVQHDESPNPRLHFGSTSRSRSIIKGAEVKGVPTASARTSSHRRRQFNKAFAACVADRASPIEHSRKWATYEVVGHIFRIYFRLKTSHLCKNIIRALNAADIPPPSAFPRAHQVTFKYYIGVLAFQGEDYAKAEEELSWALNNCLTVATQKTNR